MNKIMFVCHGNICRSPMAEFVMKKLVSQRGLADEFIIKSSATSSEEIGNPIYPPAAGVLRKHGIEPTDRRAVKLVASDYDKYDMFVLMDEQNRRNIMRMFGDDKMDKVTMLMDYTDRGGSVADPWYSGDFETAFCDIYDGCSALLENILKK